MTQPPINIEFITRENIEMLWEIILDDTPQNLKTAEQIPTLRSFFINNATGFYEKENKTPQKLMDLNKKFINNFAQSIQKDVQPKKESTSKKQLFTAEDIHSDRLSAFERGLEEKKNDFMNSMRIPVPEKPKFDDNDLDKPIGSAMGELIARTLAQRNFEIEELYKSTKKEDVEKWLKPAETSVNSEKMQQNQDANLKMEEKKKQYDYKNQVTPKFIQIGEELPTKNISAKKQISWGENKEYDANEITLEVKEIQSETSNIFSKLKYVNKPESPTIDNLMSEINNRMTILESKMDKILSYIENKIESSENNNI
jgi:hypothetical protein